MSAPVLADRPTGPRQPGTGPRYPALAESQAVARRVAGYGRAVTR